MAAGILHHALLFLLCVFSISDASITENPSPRPIKKSKKLYYQDDEMEFSYPMATTIHQGNVPIVNPTTPGNYPIVNPAPTIINPPTTTNPTTSGGGAWCIASPSASQTALQVALDYACGFGGADCSAIQPGGACFDPSTLRDHASYAFNNYYQNNPSPTGCVFGGAAQLSYTDPSHGNCRYASSSSSSTPTIPMAPPITVTPTIPITPAIPMTPTIPMAPPSTSTPVINPFTPGGNMEPPGFDSGDEPIGNPSSASSTSLNLKLLIFLIPYIVISNYF